MLWSVETATDEPCRSRHWLQLSVLTALLIVGLLGMHALVNGAGVTAMNASVASMGHASPASPGMTDAAAIASSSSASGPHGMGPGSSGCAEAMGSVGGSTCVPGPTAKSIPALPAPLPASLPYLGPAPEPVPPPETPRRLALSHLELSIYRM
jgi:hypothetical protein